MVSALISRVVILVFGTLYPAYSSYKAVKTKNVKEYVKWMMYWIVFALFTSVETFADVLVSWFPFYYELKIVFVIWLLSPATKGSSVLYRKFVHPELMKREEEIDQTLDKVKSQGYTALVNVGQQGLNFAVQSALTGQTKVMDHLMKKSLSMGDISQQPAGAQVSYRPANQQIPEEIDETDFRAHRPDYDHLQGGLATGDQVKSEFVQPHPPTEPHHRGYNLRSHEYHGGDTAMPYTATASGDPSPQHYNHREIQELPISDHEPNTESISTIISVPIEKQTVRKPRPPSKTRSRSRSIGRKRKTAISKSSASATIPTTKSDKPVGRQSSTAQSKEDQRGRASVKGPS